MRYRIDGQVVRSENAAKPVRQASAYLKTQLEADCVRGSILDYGCGRLRYAVVLRRRARSLTLVDSREQLTRRQVIHRGRTCIGRLVRGWATPTRVLDVEDFQRDERLYDFILCANVLSAIPSRSVRGGVLRLLESRLRYGGHCLLVTQYQNSYFRCVQDSVRAVRHLDGWILKSRRGTFFYGLITPRALARLAVGAGHRVARSWQHDGSAFVLTRCGRVR